MSTTARNLMLAQLNDGSRTLMGYAIHRLSEKRWEITHSLTGGTIITDPYRTLSDIIAMVGSTIPLYAQNGVDMRTVRLEVSWPTALELYAVGALNEQRLTSGTMADGDLAVLGLPLGHDILPVIIRECWNSYGSHYGLLGSNTPAA